MASQCVACGSKNSTSDDCGHIVCTICGTVSELGSIVNEVQFLENNRGGSSAVGQFVSSDAIRSYPIIQSFQAPRVSREITLRKAKKNTEALAQQLRLSSFATDTAFNFFKLAYHNGLTRGRKSSHVIGSCVYISCRTEQTPHMLIDVSDALQVDVYELGRTYLKLSTVLCIHMPIIDPSIYIWRFSCKLEFGDKTHSVSETALRLVKRMKRDWMHTGRRPSGICGAALVIAARLHNFNRTITDVIKIVKVHECTLRKRLMEFGETPSSTLTLDEFMQVDLLEEQDPPAFTAAREREKEQINQLVNQQSNLDSELTKLNQEIEKHLKEGKSKVRGPWAKYAREAETEEEAEEDRLRIQKLITEETIKCINTYLDQQPLEGNTPQNPQGLRPSAASLGIKETIEQCMEIRPSEPEPEENGELDLTGIDEDEIDSYILSSSEVKVKTEMWMKLNKVYLEEMREKEERDLREDKDGEQPQQKKRRINNKSKNKNPANTAGEAINNMVNKLKLSNKIDYDILRTLNGEEGEKTNDKPTKHLTPVETPKGIYSVMKSLIRKTGSDSDEEENYDHQIKRIRTNSYSNDCSSDKPDSLIRKRDSDSDEEENDDHQVKRRRTNSYYYSNEYSSDKPDGEDSEDEEEDEDDENDTSTAELLRKLRGNQYCEEEDEDYY
ncbi:hypothetical protein Pmani_009425 [Petrolisthes manimaculis]|uniref:Transcription factor IIIB 90 kDa subunit n=1 Tax=Petrolisthes manimaculis TaxID=1843537 RepID=A0AAE1UGQ4_9EUCA|nr:hypothetical protein Pmani_009425 [Petrolisthes manimaculis]